MEVVLEDSQAHLSHGREGMRSVADSSGASWLTTAGLNDGSIIAAELGTVVIGGMLSSTFLTLLVVPAVYALVDGLRRRLPGGTARA